MKVFLLFAALAAVCLPHGARADAEAGKAKAAVCFACHGDAGRSKNAAYPILAGQTASYLYRQLQDFKSGARKDPVMSGLAAALTPADMHDLAAYFAAQRPAHSAIPADPDKVRAGEPRSDALECARCHSDGLAGVGATPRLAGQHAAYIAKQLRDFRAQTRTNDGGNMVGTARNLNDADIDALAQYISNL